MTETTTTKSLQAALDAVLDAKADAEATPSVEAEVAKVKERVDAAFRDGAFNVRKDTSFVPPEWSPDGGFSVHVSHERGVPAVTVRGVLVFKDQEINATVTLDRHPRRDGEVAAWTDANRWTGSTWKQAPDGARKLVADAVSAVVLTDLDWTALVIQADVRVRQSRIIRELETAAGALRVSIESARDIINFNAEEAANV